MTYQLGVDLGTTYTAAAVYRDGRAQIVELGSRAAAIPSVLFVKDDDLLVGEAATRRGVGEPGRLAREFKRRFGDPTPLILGGSPFAADALTAKVLRWTVDTVTEREGGAPERVTVCHPANWGQFKKDLLEQALRLAGLTEADTITEPEAAAIYYASNERVETGTVVAVYDLGGGTFDAAVLRKTADGFEILGRPEGIEHLGGVDFDQAILAKVDEAVGGALASLDPADTNNAKAAARLRDEIVDAKEALSSDTDVSIPVAFPNLQTEVRLTRNEFEDIIRPSIAETIAALRRALGSAGIEPADVSKVLLVGGSSRIPLVAQMVSAELDRPVAVDAHPKHAIPLGAAIAAARLEAEPEAATIAMPPPEPTETVPLAAVEPTPAEPPEFEREAAPVSEPRSKAPALIMAIVVILALLAGAAWALGWPPFASDETAQTAPGEDSGGAGSTEGGGVQESEGGAPVDQPSSEAPVTESPLEEISPPPSDPVEELPTDGESP